jgi:hypothetical protein
MGCRSSKESQPVTPVSTETNPLPLIYANNLPVYLQNPPYIPKYQVYTVSPRPVPIFQVPQGLPLPSERRSQVI